MSARLPKIGALGGMHTAGIFSDMTVDGPNIGTLVVIIDRAKNLPNRRAMGKQDPYCAARLGKEAKKTTTDKRGGQTPRWDQELRFTVHDSPDYHSLKVSVFNDDKKTELIGETYVSLEAVLTPGGGQSDTWHGLNCKGKYAGEIRIELTYYDTRPKAEKIPVERKKETMRAEGQSPAVGGPRETSPVKRRPLPSDPTRASPSPSGTPDHRSPAIQSGPRPQQPRTAEHTPTHQRRSHNPDEQHHRRPLPDVLPMNGTPSSDHHIPHHQQRTTYSAEHESYSPSPNPPSSGTQQYNDGVFDMSYTAPKPYEVQHLDPTPPHVREHGHRPMSQEDFRSSRGHTQGPADLTHSHSAPIVPSQQAYDGEPHRHDSYEHSTEGYSDAYALHQENGYSRTQNSYDESSYHVAPLRTSRSGSGLNQYSSQEPYEVAHGYISQQDPYDPFASQIHSSSSMQPTVEDEDDIPPPPPAHRSSAVNSMQLQQTPPSYHKDAPAPLNVTRYKEEVSHGYASPPQHYVSNEYSTPPSERRYTHPQPPQPLSRPVSRDTMAPSPLRQETSMIPSSLVAGFDASRPEDRMVMRGDNRDSDVYATSSYETPLRLRQHSEPDHRSPQHYDTPPRPHPLSHHQSFPSAESPDYYPHPPPQEPRHTSPVHEPAPIIKPRAVSPGNTHPQLDHRNARATGRSMPTRKSVSPRPPPSTADAGERRLSGIPFNPDSFDVLNPAVTKGTKSGVDSGAEKDRRSSNVEVNDKGQVVTFSGRVIDASDHLPLDSWAPEPERKGPQKERPTRAPLSGARDIESARQRERDYRRERMERERIRNAVTATHGEAEDNSTALVAARHRYSSSNGSPMNAGTMVLPDHDSTPPGSGGRNRLQKRAQRPVSSFVPSKHSSPSNIPSPNTQILRERENPSGYSGSPGYGAGNRHSVAAPPIPAKIPLDAGYGQSEDMAALSLELQSIDIGPGSGGRNRGTARRYGGY